MSSYRRFVTYLFQYENAVKGRNCGFAKVGMSQEQTRMQIQLNGLADGDYPVYLCAPKEDFIEGVPVGILPVCQEKGNVLLSVRQEVFTGTPCRMDAMKGIYIPVRENVFAASQWTDEKMAWEHFRISGKEDPERHEEEKTEELQMQASRTDPASQPVSYGDAWEQQWQQFLAAHPSFFPYDEEKTILAVKIDLRDLRILPGEYRSLGSNRFLLHGYFSYQHILLGQEDGEKKRWFLGVPGVFQNQEQLLAGLFGFPEFRTKHRTKQKTGEFGYWIRYMDL